MVVKIRSIDSEIVSFVGCPLVSDVFQFLSQSSVGVRLQIIHGSTTIRILFTTLIRFFLSRLIRIIRNILCLLIRLAFRLFDRSVTSVFVGQGSKVLLLLTFLLLKLKNSKGSSNRFLKRLSSAYSVTQRRLRGIKRQHQMCSHLVIKIDTVDQLHGGEICVLYREEITGMQVLIPSIEVLGQTRKLTLHQLLNASILGHIDVGFRAREVI